MSSNRWGFTFMCAIALGLFAGATTARAVVITKGDNTNTLNLGTSWAGGTAPGTADVADWSGPYNTAGSLSAGLGAATDWGGISIGNISGTAAGLVSVGGTGASTHSLRVRGSGVDMSTANQNLVLNATGFDFSDSQTWNVAAGRNLRLGSTGTGAGNANIDGSATTVITISGGGVVDANQGGVSGFADAAGAAGYGGKWIIGSNTTLRGLRNGATAWGSNTAADAITLNGGTLAVGGISGSQGNWTWETPITISSGTTGKIDQQIFSGTGRSLILRGAFTGSGVSTNLAFLETGATNSFDNDDFGYIIAGNASLSSDVTVTIGGATENGIGGRLSSVRVGGVSTATSTSTAAGTGGTLGNALIVNNGVLTLSRSDAWTFGNNVSGTGSLRIGGGVSGANTQVVTLSGTNTYTGATTISRGEMKISGSTNTTAGAVSVGSGVVGALTITGTGSLATTGTLQLGNGIIGNLFTVDSGGTVNVGSINNPWQTSYVVNGAVTSTGGWSITTNATSSITGAGTVSAASLSTGNAATIVNYGGTGSISLTGLLTLAATTSGQVNITSTGTVNTSGIAWGGATNKFTLGGGGRINIGASGIANTGGTSRTVELGLGTVGAYANWSSALPISLTNSVTGTTFITLDSVNGVTARSISLSGALTGVGKLIKTGAGTLSLSNAGNSYSGDTEVNGGTLLVIGALSSSTNDVVVNAGGTLGGSGSIAGTVSSLGGVIAPGTSAGTLNINNTFTLNGSSVLDFELDGTLTTIGSGVNDLINGVTNLTLDGTLNVTALGSFAGASLGDTWRLINYSGSLTNNGLLLGSLPSLGPGLVFQLDTATAGEVNLTIVPEPSSLAMLAFGMISLWLVNPKRRER